MGVTGLWTLLAPVGRPAQLENMEGKKMAIDSSIWLYQFQATMRDKEGRALVNAHILGFLRRISKLLFYGIRPVFVFDGGAPTLKKSTIGERKKKKEGAAQSYARTAEKILAAQMRREALNRRGIQHTTEEDAAEVARTANEDLLADAVYQEDLDGSSPTKSASSKDKGKQKAQPSPASAPETSPKKNKWHDHDPYRLPDINMADIASKAANASAPDPRLATEDELRQFIEEMVPEDFDTHSEAFRSLPTEAQYEIIGDLRLKSRQTSYARLESMLASAPTALDFSKAQIVNLKQRNALTQTLLATVETVGRSQYTIMPTRIASERNRQYVLVRNQGPDGGWVLGIRDEGTVSKPIDVDANESDEDISKVLRPGDPTAQDSDDDDDDMEEIVPHPPRFTDPDLRDHRRELTLKAVNSRDTDKRLAPLRTRLNAPTSRPKLPTPVRQKSQARPLFLNDDDDGDQSEPSNEEDPELQLALQQSLEDDEEREAEELTTALAESAALHAEAEREDLSTARQFHSSRASGYSGSTYVTLMSRVNGPAAKFAAIRNAAMGESVAPGASPDRHNHTSPTTPRNVSSSFMKHTPSTPSPSLRGARPSLSPSSSKFPANGSDTFSSRPLHSPSTSHTPPKPRRSFHPEQSSEFVVPKSPRLPSGKTPEMSPQSSIPTQESVNKAVTSSTRQSIPTTPIDAPEDDRNRKQSHDVGSQLFERPPTTPAPLSKPTPIPALMPSPLPHRNNLPNVISDDDEDMEEVLPSVAKPRTQARLPSVVAAAPSIDAAEIAASPIKPPIERPQSPPRVAQAVEEEHTNDWDAAEEMDVDAEQDQFANFYSQIQDRSVDQIRSEIDAEIRSLQAQKKAAMRDSEDITQQMVGQIKAMLRLFGIPFVTAPMEAEAQCAALVSLGLVEGIITDDSDVFLFGGERVFRNMFNQSKTVECFLAVDLSRELGLDRDTLVRLAFLLGSDYTEGLPGVGPVLAMELLKEFPGEDGLHRFKDWWRRVQSGRDLPEDNNSSFRKRFKKRFKDLHLTEDWPPAVVRDAYYHPTIDESEEPFKWGQPDLDALRQFLNTELGWGSQKVDDTLLPIIRKVGQRAKSGGTNQQSTMEAFFDASIGSGTYAPRKRAPYASKRLQKVVTDFRKEQKARAAGSEGDETQDTESESGSSSVDETLKKPPQKGKAPRKKITADSRPKMKPIESSDTLGRTDASTSTSAPASKPTKRAKRKPGTSRAKTAPSKKRKVAVPSSEGEEDVITDAQQSVGAVPDRPLEVTLRPRPKPRYKPKVNSPDWSEDGQDNVGSE